MKNNRPARNKPPRKNRTTNITANQFAELTDMVRLTAAAPRKYGRPIRLPLAEQVKLTCSYLRTNVTEQFLGDMYGVSQPTVSRILTRMTPVLGWLLRYFVPGPEEASAGTALLIDGSLLPCWSWKGKRELYSGKHKTTGHNVQLISDLTGRLIYLSPPLPGSIHDTHRAVSILESHPELPAPA